jgi:aryl-alcohol dehydrogenase-like predicted oxidoreductase
MLVKRPLGDTDIAVSEVALGTVELGMDYGFRGTTAYQRPGRREAISLVRRAVERGINLIDTAPVYGESETIIGEALQGLADRPYIATKVTVPATGKSSVESSLKALRLETLDVVQVHNATPATLQSNEVLQDLEDLVRSGKVRYLGASVYDVESALIALDNRLFRLLQVPFHLLDQKMADCVFPRATAAGVGVVVRSAFFRGVLAGAAVPPQLAPFERAAQAAFERARGSAASMAELALRFCLSIPAISSVLIGVRSAAELDHNLAAAEQGPLDAEVVGALRGCSLGDDAMLNPMNWKGLI